MRKDSIMKETIAILNHRKLEILYKFLISILYRGTLLIIPILWGKTIDAITAGKFEDGYRMVFITLAVVIGYYVSACINQKIYYKLYNKLYESYTNLIYKSVFNNSLYSLSRFKLGEFSNIVNNDIDITVGFLDDTIIKIVQIIEFFIIFYYFSTINGAICIITILLCILMLALLLSSSKKMKKTNQSRKYHLDKKFAVTHEVFHNVKEIKGFYVFQSINERVKHVYNEYLKANEEYSCFSYYIKQFILAVIELARYGLVIYGISLSSKGQMEIGTIIVIYTYYGKVIENYDVVGALLIGLEDFKVSLLRLGKLLEYRRIETNDDFAPLQDYQGNVTFSNILYGNLQDPILDNVSFEIAANTITAITGSPGSGKTGVFDLLMKLNRQHQGDIYMDNISYERIDDETYFNLVALARKDPHFFDLSIKDNLMLVAKDFSEIKDICEKLNIHEEIMQLKNQYNTQINDTSEKVSSDLKTTIAIARVFLKQSKIMMFDESISVLDKKYQQIVLDLLEEYKKNHTIMIISRDEIILERADRIITFENNKVEEIINRKRKTKWI